MEFLHIHELLGGGLRSPSAFLVIIIIIFLFRDWRGNVDCALALQAEVSSSCKQQFLVRPNSSFWFVQAEVSGSSLGNGRIFFPFF